MKLLGALVITVVLTSAPACGGGGGSIEHPSQPADLVLRVETGGGFVPPEFHLRAFPELSLFGDGRLIVPGAQIEIYPGPALPSLLERPVSEEGVQAVLAAAAEAGLLGPDRHYDRPGIADAPTTVFTLVADGARHVVSAYALGFEEPGLVDLSEEELAARRALADFQTRLFDLASWLPVGSLGEETPYAFSELRVYARPYELSPEPSLEQSPKPWPLTEPLDSFGEPKLDVAEGLRCGVVSGEDLELLEPQARASNELTPWESGGARYQLIFRPLLPDEHGCG